MKHFWMIGPALILMGLGHSLLAQSTWNGLRFGESHAEVAQALKAKGMTIDEAAPDVINVQSTYEVSAPDTPVKIPFRVQVLFSKSGLRQVNLGLDSDSIVQKIGNLYSAIEIVNRSMKNALTAKYGAPIAKDAGCDAEGNSLVEKMLEGGEVQCNASWRSEGQLISVDWWADQARKSFTYVLSYEGSSSDL